MLKKISNTRFSLLVGAFVLHLLINFTSGESCSSDKPVYGENGLIDRLLACTISKSSDIDLTTNGHKIKSTARSLVEQGLAEKTTISHASLSGFWTSRRPSFVNSEWICHQNKTTVSSLIEVSGLAMNLIEKMDIPLSQHNSTHKPCATFNLPATLCQQSRPIYRVVKTWVDRAYFNVTLSQSVNPVEKPVIQRLIPIFTCPETFLQRMSYSPSAVYIFPRQVNSNSEPSNVDERDNSSSNELDPETSFTNPIVHPLSFVTTQSEKSASLPTTIGSIKSILNKSTAMLRSSLVECIESLDSDLQPLVDHTSFEYNKYNLNDIDNYDRNDTSDNACSNKVQLSSRIDIANQAIKSETISGTASTMAGYTRRSHIALDHRDSDLVIDQVSFPVLDIDQMIDRR